MQKASFALDYAYVTDVSVLSMPTLFKRRSYAELIPHDTIREKVVVHLTLLMKGDFSHFSRHHGASSCSLVDHGARPEKK